MMHLEGVEYDEEVVEDKGSDTAAHSHSSNNPANTWGTQSKLYNNNKID